MKVFKVNDSDYYMAETLDQAIETCLRDTGLPRDEMIEDPYELTPAAMAQLKFVEGDDRRTFQEELERRIATDNRPQCFASEDY